MNLAARTQGVILFTDDHAGCVAFYRDLIGLPLWFEKPGLTCLRFGDGYLMVEQGGSAVPAGKDRTQNPTVLRFNVEDVEAAADTLRGRGVDVDVRHFDWGSIGGFTDPDGNRCELKDAGDPFFAAPA